MKKLASIPSLTGLNTEFLPRPPANCQPLPSQYDTGVGTPAMPGQSNSMHGRRLLVQPAGAEAECIHIYNLSSLCIRER
jgi:hypothetical protein